MRVLLKLCVLASVISASEWQKYCVDTVCNRCRSYLVRTMDENAKHYRRCLAITINPECCQFETNLHFNVFPVTNPACRDEEPDSKLKLSKMTQSENCTEHTLTLKPNETDSESNQLDDFLKDFDEEVKNSTKFQEELNKIQQQKYGITINSKKCEIILNEYKTCKEIRSDQTYNNTIHVSKYVIISLCSCAFGIALVHFWRWSKSDTMRRQSNFVERQRSQVQSPQLAHSATLTSVDVRFSPSEKDSLTKHV